MNSTRWIMLSIVVVLFISIGIGIALVQRAPAPSPQLEVAATDPQLEKRLGADTSSVAADGPTAPLGIPTVAPSDHRMAFLLLGYGGGGHDGAYLADSMMLAIADPKQKTLALLSLPRDSWVPLLFDGRAAVYNKLTTAYAFAKDASLYRNRLPRYSGDQGAGHFAVDTVSRLIGVPVNNYLGLDFDGFRQMIDTVGGIDVDVPDSFTARYPANDDPSIDPSWTTVRFTKGLEHMNGERALRFARAREAISNMSEGSDFARSRRQRLIIEAFKSRLFTPGGLIHLPQLLPIAADHVDTDYTIPAAGQLGQFLLDWKNVQIYQAAVTTENYLDVATGPEGTYVLVPSAPDRSWAQIRAFARRLSGDPATGVAVANTRITVVNHTGIGGLATRLSTALAMLGYSVGTPATGEQRADSRLVDRTGGKAALVVKQLEKDLGVHFLESAQSPDTASNDLVLELGTDDAGIADLSVPTDDGAPASAVGIERYGGWSPAMPAETVVVTTVSTRTVVAPTATPTRPPARPAARPAPPSVNGNVVVPSVIGLSEGAAREAIDAAGLSNTYSNYQGPGDVPERTLNSVSPGHVLSQTPEPGSLLPPGAPVYLAVRKP